MPSVVSRTYDAPEQPLPVMIVGAGVACLTAAVALHESGVPIHVYEAAGVVGGRLRTDRQADGFLLDRGFQVVFDACPTVPRSIDVAALRPGHFNSGAMLWTGRHRAPLVNPLRHPCGFARKVARIIVAPDKLRLGALAARVARVLWHCASEAAVTLGGDVVAMVARELAFARPAVA